VNDSILDVNVHLSRWPTRRVQDDETANLVATLRSHGVEEAWAGSFEGLLHKDLASVNARLVHECRAQKDVRLVPFGSVNPRLPDWEDDLRRCAEEHAMPGIRLHPNYHGYALDDPQFVRLVQLSAERGLIVTLALEMEDERMMHPLMRVPPVDVRPLSAVVEQAPEVRLILLNALRTLRGELLWRLLGSGKVYVEISMLEGVGCVEKLLQDVPADRVLFGSHAPHYYFESAVLKLRESFLAREQLRDIFRENARKILVSTG
jgi:predicted TIM-barrel fold metal-dependent hydrolase